MDLNFLQSKCKIKIKKIYCQKLTSLIRSNALNKIVNGETINWIVAEKDIIDA